MDSPGPVAPTVRHTWRAWRARYAGRLDAGRYWLLPVAVSQAFLLRSARFTPVHDAVHLIAAAVPVLAVLACTRTRAFNPARVLLLVLAGQVVSVAPVLLLTDGTGGEHPARLSLPESVTGSFSAVELGWYAVCVGTLALVLLLVRRRRAATPTEQHDW